MSEAGRKARGALANTALLIASCVLTALLVEGSASAYLFAHDVVLQRPVGLLIRPHTMPDTLLGWVNRAGFSSVDEYGAGIGVSTDAQGFRGTRSLAPTAPVGAVRVACSGDAVAFGYGVDDAHAWCARLEAELPGVETMNLGQAGYGLDQAYLRYMRDGVRIEHQLQILALTDALLERTFAPNYAGAPKPRVALEGAQLAVHGVPVPAATDDDLQRAAQWRLLDDLRMVQLARRVRGSSAAADAAHAVEAQWPLIDAMLASLADGHRARGSELMVVYLPNRPGLRSGPSDVHRQSIARSAAAHGLTFVDLTEPLRSMRPDSLDLAFIDDVPAGAAPGVRGNYSNIGNAWIARELAARVREMPRTGALVRTTATARAAKRPQ